MSEEESSTRELAKAGTGALVRADASRRARSRALVRSIDELKDDAEKVGALSPRQIIEAAKSIAVLPSTALTGIVGGVLGGVLGGVGGIALGTLVGGVSSYLLPLAWH